MLARIKLFLRNPLMVGAGFFLLIFALGLGALAYLESDTRREIELLAIASSDNTPWNLAQGEIELQAFENALLQVDPDNSASIRAAKTRFDIFYSRIRQFERAKASANVIAKKRDQLDMAVRFLDDAVMYIDGSERDFITSIPKILEMTDELKPALREISLLGSIETSTRATERRNRVFVALEDMSFSIILLFAMLISLMIILMLMVNASQRKTREIGLAEQRLKSIISTSLDAILVCSKEGLLLDCNGAAEKLFKSVHADAVGSPIEDLFIECDASTIPAGADHIAKRAAGLGPVMLHAKNTVAEEFPIELTCASTESADGPIYVMFVRDISKRLAAEQELVLARDRAVAGETAKANLLAVMSHEMRTPLNGVLGAVELLADTDTTPKQREMIDVLETSGQVLMKHVNNVLDISRADAGMIQVSADNFDLSDTVQQVANSMRSQAEERGNRLRVLFPEGPVGLVKGDQWRLNQILINLLGNAIKFTQNGTIDLEIERQPATDTVTFRVIDSGVGIDSEDLHQIFDDFVTLDTSYNREVEGTGLGLGIVKRLVTILDGEIGVESDIGSGSVFWFNISLPKAEAAQQTDDADKSASPRQIQPIGGSPSILLVEDNEINRTVVGEMLTRIGCKIKEAADGAQGVAVAREEKFDLILMDVSMPGMDGMTASKQILGDVGPNQNTPILALTAYTHSSDIEACLEAGMSEVLTKPVSINTLRDAIVRHVEGLSSEINQTDASEMASILGADRAREITRSATTELREGIQKLQSLIENEAESKAIADHVHRLAGTAALLPDKSLHGSLTQIEQLAKTGTLAELSESLSDLRRMLEETAT